MTEKRPSWIFSQLQGAGGIYPSDLKANPPMSAFFKGGFISRRLFKDKLKVANNNSVDKRYPFL
jgi:hypothetical protein